MKKTISIILACIIFIIGIFATQYMMKTEDLFYDIICSIIGTICLSPSMIYYYDKFLNT